MDLNEILKENPRLAEWHTNVESLLQSKVPELAEDM